MTRLEREAIKVGVARRAWEVRHEAYCAMMRSPEAAFRAVVRDWQAVTSVAS